MIAPRNGFTPRRMVEMAKHFGESVLVYSICTEDFSPAIQHLTDMLHRKID